MDYRALIFVPALVGCVVFGFVFALFAANHYLTVLQSTGSGAKQVVWVSEPMVDNFWKVFYLGWLIGLWLGPAWLLGRAFATSVDQPWMRYAVPLSVFWICYPVSQLSSLSGPSIWLPLHYEVFARLARKPEMVISFLVVSGITLVGLGLSFHWTFNATGTVWLFIGAPLFIASALLYARLLGRVAFALMYTRSIFSRKKKKKPKAPNSDISSPAEIEPEAEEEFVQPSELPPIQTPDEGPLTGYNIDFEGAKPKPVRKRVRAESAGSEPNESGNKPEPEARSVRPVDAADDDATSYGMYESEVQPEERLPESVVKPSESEMRLLNRDDAPKAPKRLWTPEVFGFLLQPETLVVIALLTTICVMVGGLVRLAREFNPVGEGS